MPLVGRYPTPNPRQHFRSDWGRFHPLVRNLKWVRFFLKRGVLVTTGRPHSNLHTGLNTNTPSQTTHMPPRRNCCNRPDSLLTNFQGDFLKTKIFGVFTNHSSTWNSKHGNGPWEQNARAASSRRPHPKAARLILLKLRTIASRSSNTQSMYVVHNNVFVVNNNRP